MTRRVSNATITSAAVALALVFSGCGGGTGSTSGGGPNGGAGRPTMSISLLSPSSIMTGVPQGLVTIYGKGFLLQGVQVLVDGVPITQTQVIDDTTVQVTIPEALDTAVGTHQFTVQNATNSSSLPFTVYTPQPGPQVMQALPGFLVGNPESDPYFVVTADINGDGLSDVIMQGPSLGGSPSIAILYGQADGLLSSPQYVPTPFTPLALAAGDVDGDGNIDLVYLMSNAPNTITVTTLLGDGHGNFQAAAQQALSALIPYSSYLADLDGDGRPDLIVSLPVGSGITTSLVWFKNLGSGNFAAAATLASMTAGPASVADFNGDGKPDILYTTAASAITPQSFRILINSGNGQFLDQAAAGLNGIVGTVTVMDFNLDGIPDLVVQVFQGTNQLYSFAGKGDGSFTQVASQNIGIGPVRFVVGDFDHDGFPDLAGPVGLEPSEILFVFGDGHGNFVPQEVVGPEGYYAAVGDFNGDGLPDIVVADRFNFVSLALGRTDRNFLSPLSLTPATATGISAGDVNGDGLPELLVAGDPIAGIPGTIFLNQGNNSFQLAAYTDPGTFMLADLTGKGVADLLGGKATNLIIWPNNGTLDFSSSPITVPQPMSDVSVADMDGDGHPDIVALGQIFYGNGAYQFTPISFANPNAFGWPYAIGDFNGDGRLDLIDTSFTYLNTGSRTFQQVPGNNLGLSFGYQVVVADFNGDGKDDLALISPTSSIISIYYSRGDGTFYQETILDAGQHIGMIAVGDFNGDGRPDIAAGLISSHQVCLFFNNGQGQFTRSFFASGANTDALIAVDLNRDGKPDLAITNAPLSFLPPNVAVIFHK